MTVLNETAKAGHCDCPSADGECPHCGRQATASHKDRCHRAAIAGRTYLDNPPACAAPEDWPWGYLPCGCSNDGYGRHRR